MIAMYTINEHHHYCEKIQTFCSVKFIRLAYRMMWYGINTSDMFGLAALIMASGVASYEDYSNANKMFKSIMLYLFQFVKNIFKIFKLCFLSVKLRCEAFPELK